jgi:hypothetical protein
MSTWYSLASGSSMSSSARGPSAFTSSTKLGADVLRRDRDRVLLRVALEDGATLTGWANASALSGGASETMWVGSATTGCRVLAPPPVSCDHVLSLHVRKGKGERIIEVGTIDAGTLLDAEVMAPGDTWAVVTPREGTAYSLEEGWQWVVPADSFSSCVLAPPR